MKLSIIVPVFNVEEFLANCLKSLVTQDLPKSDYEIIVINDGSSDKSKEIILDYQKKYNNIVFIDQENQGVSVARNKGIDIAKGNYITFVDSDDLIYENALQLILKRLESDDLDLLYLNIECYNEAGTKLDYDYKIGDDAIIADGFTHQRRTYTPTVYKKDVIGTIRFNSNIVIGEDTVFNGLVQSKAKRCSYSSIPYYKYLVRTNSATKKIRTQKAFNGFIAAIENVASYKKENVTPSNQKQNDYFDAIIIVFITRIIEFNILPNFNLQRFNKVKEILNQYQLLYLTNQIATNFKFFNANYILFYYFHKMKSVKRILTKFIKK